MKVENVMNKKERFGLKLEMSNKVIEDATSKINQIVGENIELEDVKEKIINNIQLEMLSSLNKVYEVEMDKETEFKLFKTILNSPKNIDPISNIIKCIPGMGSLIGSILSTTMIIANTKIMGTTYLNLLEHYFNVESGKVELPENTDEVLTYFMSIVKNKEK